MRIVYDHQAFGMQSHGGVSRYFCEVANRIAALGADQVEIVAPLHISRHLGSGNAVKLRGWQVPRLPGTNQLRRRASGILSRALLWHRHDVDIFHETYFTGSDACPRSARRILTVYDMIHERLPDYFSKSDRTAAIKRTAAERADHIICISEKTRQDILAITGIDRNKTSVVALGCSLDINTLPDHDPIALARPFILYVGARAGYKNFASLLRAFSSSSRLKDSFALVCFGGGKFTPEELTLAQSSGLKEENIFQVPGNDSVLAALYTQAAALVYPSLYEGFGIPPLEAMSFDCPVVCSNTGSLPEVVGDAAEFFSPTDNEGMRAAIERVVLSPTRSETLVRLGRERSRFFSWDRCARETLDVYHRVLGS